MLQLNKLSEAYDLRVYTDKGEFFGEVEEAIVSKSRISGWKIKSSRNSYLSKMLDGGAKGVIVPHRLVRAVSDVMLISSTVGANSFENSSE